MVVPSALLHGSPVLTPTSTASLSRRRRWTASRDSADVNLLAARPRSSTAPFLSTAIFNVTTGKEAVDKDEEEEDEEDNRVEEPEDEAPEKGVSCKVCRQCGMEEAPVSL